MTNLKMLAAAASATAVLGVAGVFGPAAASAEPKSCAQAHGMAAAYLASAELYESYGFYSLASYYYGKAEAIVEGC